MKVIDVEYPSCPVRNVIGQLFTDKWTILVLCKLFPDSVMRYGDLKKAIPNISQKMLTNTLNKLTEYHLIERKSHAEFPPRVEYFLTEIGKAAMPGILEMINWARCYFDDIMD